MNRIIKDKEIKDKDKIKVEDNSKKVRRLNSNTESFFDEEFSHSGVIGMKWGVRKSPSANTKVRRDRAKMRKNRRTLSDQELKRAVNRMQMEKKLKILAEEDLTPGKLAAKDFLSKVGGSAAAAAAGVAGAALMKKYLSSKGIDGG